jgi:hypothetical protein
MEREGPRERRKSLSNIVVLALLLHDRSYFPKKSLIRHMGRQLFRTSIPERAFMSSITPPPPLKSRKCAASHLPFLLVLVRIILQRRERKNGSQAEVCFFLRTIDA